MPTSWDNAEAAAAALNDPALSAADLATIAYAQAALRPRVVGHPAAYPGLLDWLRALGDPAVDAAFAQAAGPAPNPYGYDAAGSAPVPGYPQPGAPYPPTGPNQWAGQYPTPMTGPSGGPVAPQPKPKKSRKGLLIGLIAATVVVVLAVVGVFVVLPKLGGSGGGSYQLAPDFSAKPVAGQRINIPFDDVDMDTVSVWVGSSPVKGKAVAVIEPVVPYSDGDDSRWYDGYDEDYADGFAAGQAFLDEVDADYAYLSDYYDFDRAESQAGYSDGFDDAEYEFGFGYSAATGPGASSTDLPPALVQLFDLATGELDWTIEVEDATGTAVPYLWYPVFEAGGTMMVITATLGEAGWDGPPASDEGGEHTLFAIDVRDGSYTMRDFSSAIEVVSVVDGIVVVSSDETMSAYRLDDIDGAVVWKADSLRSDAGSLCSGILSCAVGTQWVLTDNGYVSIADGKPAGFGSDSSMTIRYYQDEGGAVYRFENFGDFEFEITKWDIGSDKPAWDSPVEVALSAVPVESGGNLLTFDQEAEKLIAFSTSTGNEVWSQRLAGQDNGYDLYYTVVQTDSWFAYTTSASRVELLDSATGKQGASIRPSCDEADYANLRASATALYVECGGTLTAYEAVGKNAGDERWSFKLKSGETVVSLVDQLAVQTRNDDGSITIRLLEAN